MLRPVYPPWKTDKNGRWKLDARGDRIPHPRAFTRKDDKDLTEDERRYVDWAIKRDESVKRARARKTLEPIAQAKETLGQR